MQERVLKLSDLSEYEQKHLREWAEDESNPNYRMQGDDKVIVRDETEAVVDDEDPRAGVDATGVAMTDEVARLLEEPFEDGEPTDSTQKQSAPEPEEDEKPFEPEPADVRNFLRCMLGNKRFTKAYSAYGGSLQFTLGARTHAQDEDIVFGCANMNQVRALAHMTNMRLAYSLIELRIGDEVQKFPGIDPGQRVSITPSGGDLVDQAQDASKTMLATDRRVHDLMQLPQAIYGVLSTQMREFDMLVTVLTQRANDPKHWATVSVD